ncbi:MAG TPA: VWA domain-containing protein [Roseiflexaceae bacterium]|nr:VWA domain-containing protein [Roseiflexaceae bacterium]
MRLSFITPTALWLLLVLVPLWVLAFVTPHRRATAGLWLSLLIRTTLIAALILALGGARIVRDTSALTTVFLLDRSESIAPEARGRAEAFVRQALGAMPTGDRAAVVTFGANALVERPADEQQAFDGVTTTPLAAGTNIQEAMQLGLSLLPAETNKRMVLLSDGGQNAGDAATAARLASAHGVPLSYVDIGLPSSAAEAAVSDLHAPTSVRTGQSLQLTVTVESTVAERAHLRVLGDNQVISEQDVALQPGSNRFAVSAQAGAAGIRRYRAEIVPQGDTRAENNAAEALVRVDGPPRVLLVIGTPGAGLNFRQALGAANVQVDRVVPADLKADLNALSVYDAVVLIDVPAQALPPQAMTTLPAYVHDLGKGLVMVGGNQSFGLGGYAKTPIEQALPVYMDAPTLKQRPNIALVFVLDKSSSASGCHCRGPDRKHDGYFDHDNPFNLDVAKQAVKQSVAVLDPRDEVSVVTFDEVATMAFAPQRGPTPDQVMSAIAPIKPIGRTNIFAGLALAQQTLNQSQAAVKHIILFTDGLGPGGDTIGQAQQFAQQGITLSVVGEGFGAVDYLTQLAHAGNGRYIQVQNTTTDVPQIFLQETQSVSSKFSVEQAFTPAYGAASPILSGLEQGLPPLYGYNGTTPKQTATVALLDADGSPVLAQWQYGLGRTIAWTSDLQSHWARDWVSWPEFPRFAAQLLGWVLPNVSGSGLQADLQPQGQRTQIAVTALDAAGQPRTGLDMRAVLLNPDGTQREVALAAEAPGVYRGSMPSPPPGSYSIQIVGAQAGQVVAQDSVALVVPYSPEYRIGQANPALLDQLARATGGAPLAQPADAFARLDQHVGAAQEIALPLLLLALILLPIDIAVRRLIVVRRLRAASRPAAGRRLQPR